MKTENLALWTVTPGTTESVVPYLVHYMPDEAKTTAAVLIIPGSGYFHLPSNPVQEGARVAEYLCREGMHVFVLIYRVAPDAYPDPLLDGRRAMRYIRYHAAKLGIDKGRICTLGYSAGGHLASTLTGYRAPLAGEGADEIDREAYAPDLQALCYPVISLDCSKPYTHKGSAQYLLLDRYDELYASLCMDTAAEGTLPPTFLYHNFDDASVGVENSLLYAARLKALGASVEMHIYPHGGHGIGLPNVPRHDLDHDKAWIGLYVAWLRYNAFL